MKAQETTPASRHGQSWTDDEIAATAGAYAAMLRDQHAGRPFSKADVVKELLDGPLSGRSRKAVEYRFCNISAVLSNRSLPTVEGFKPLPHVAKKHRALIARLIVGASEQSDVGPDPK